MDGALRRASLIHLNVGPGFEGLTPDYVPNMRVSTAVSSKQEETRRNIFWMCYVNERYHAQFLAQAMITVDEDISQALPTRGDLLEQGVRFYVSIQFFHRLVNEIISYRLLSPTPSDNTFTPPICFSSIHQR